MINIYLDTSGSMTEMGKDSAILYIAKSVQDYCTFKSIETTFLKLNGDAISGLESIKYTNDVQLEVQNIKANSILISDGLFEVEDIKVFDIAISVGVDANLLNLEKISERVFISDNILAALESLIFHNVLLGSVPKILEEDEDEW